MNRHPPSPISPSARTRPWAGKNGALVGLALGATLALAACGPPVRVTTTPLPDDHPLESRSTDTVDLLRQTLLAEGFEEQPLAVLEALDWLPREPGNLFTVAELAYLKAEEVQGLNPALAETLYLWSAVRSHDFLRLFPDHVAHGSEARDTYNWALGRYLALLQRRDAYPPRDHQVSFPRGTIFIQVERGGGALGDVWPPEYFEQLYLAGELGIEGLRNRFTLPGVGAPMIGFRTNRGTEPIERFYPPEGIVRPITAILHLDPILPSTASTAAAPATPGVEGIRRARLVFYNPLERDTVQWNGREEPLAADFTAPLGFLVANTALEKVGRLGVRNADKLDRHAGVFLMQPYDPERIPVLMIHGLLSSPLAWRELTNEMLADPVLRRRYQVWHYFYPSALPYLYSGQRLEANLERLYGFLQRETTAPALNRMVIVAHSMGGLLARTLITDSGEKVWNRAARVPPETLRGTPADIDLVRDMFHFTPRPYIERVIFLATPHKGSNLAGSLVGKIGASLVDLPDDYETLFRRISQSNLDYLTPEMRKVLASGGPTSIQSLSPKHPMIQVLSELPISPRVKVHSILGRKGHDGPLKESTDGIVPYWSSHLPWADSQLVVESGHAVYNHPGTIQEIKRILYLHLER